MPKKDATNDEKEAAVSGRRRAAKIQVRRLAEEESVEVVQGLFR
jgi:hypothetical protein